MGALNAATTTLGSIDDVNSNSGELIASFDGRSVTYGFGELDMLVPAYAATIHKSQGSEYPAVIIPVLTQHYAMLQRNLLYTGVTRGKKLVVLVGQKKAVAIAVRNVSGRKRGRSSASGCGQNRLSHDSSAWPVEPAGPSFARPQVQAMRASLLASAIASTLWCNIGGFDPG